MGPQEQMPPNGVTIYIATDDINGHLKKIEKAGGKMIVPRTEIPNVVTFAQFMDPFGNVVGLVEDSGKQQPQQAAEAKPAKAAKANGAKKANGKANGAKAKAAPKAAKAAKAAPKKAAKAAPKKAAKKGKAAAKDA
jgi:hypothetical protein